MAKKRGRTKDRPPPAVTDVTSSVPSRRGPWLLAALVVGAIAILSAIIVYRSSGVSGSAADPPPRAATEQARGLPVADPKLAAPPAAGELLQSNTVYMVTKELDLGPGLASVADAVRQIERRSVPDDGQGRTFAVLSATGEPISGGTMRVSMHLSLEEPGAASLVFRPTGEVLWSARVVPGPPSTNPYAAKGLVVMLPDAGGRPRMVDGSRGIASIFDGVVPDLETTVDAMWPDAQEREVVFIHSTCGCPVKVKVRRSGRRTVRSTEQPVIFPDDPQVADSIRQLMGW